MSIIVLGKPQSYSDLAAQSFIRNLSIEDNRIYFDHISQCFEHFTEEDLLVLPVENAQDGFLQRHLDLLFESKATIIAENYQSITFDFVSSGHFDDIRIILGHETVFNQCTNFLKQFSHIGYVNTPNNIYTLEHLIERNDPSIAAMIPVHINPGNFKTNIKGIQDLEKNQTRFFLLSKKSISKQSFDNSKGYFVVTPKKDFPGLLQDILKDFSSQGINLTSIISRPDKSSMGHYRFFIEVYLENSSILSSVLNRENHNYEIDFLGTYKKEG